MDALKEVGLVSLAMIIASTYVFTVWYFMDPIEQDFKKSKKEKDRIKRVMLYPAIVSGVSMAIYQLIGKPNDDYIWWLLLGYPFALGIVRAVVLMMRESDPRK